MPEHNKLQRWMCSCATMPSDKIVPEKIYQNCATVTGILPPALVKYKIWNRSKGAVEYESLLAEEGHCCKHYIMPMSKILNPVPTDIVPTKSLQPLWNAMMWCMRMPHIQVHITRTVYSWISDHMRYNTVSFLAWIWLNLLRCHRRYKLPGTSLEDSAMDKIQSLAKAHAGDESCCGERLIPLPAELLMLIHRCSMVLDSKCACSPKDIVQMRQSNGSLAFLEAKKNRIGPIPITWPRRLGKRTLFLHVRDTGAGQKRHFGKCNSATPGHKELKLSWVKRSCITTTG